MIKKTIEYKDFTLEYSLLRDSKKLDGEAVFCFHGFGRQLEDFEIFTNCYSSDLSVFSFNIFQHGKSRIKESRLWNQPILKEEALDLFKFLLQEFNLNRIHLLGYSIGGRMALILTELMPGNVASLNLISPDGIKNSPVYLFASKTKLGIAVFKLIIEKPNFFFSSTKILRKIGLVSKSQYRVMMLNLETYELRKMVGETWYVFSRMNPDIAKIQGLINKQKIPTILLFGKYDKVIPIKIGLKFESGLDKQVLHTIQMGHALMNKKVALKLKQLIEIKEDKQLF